MGDIASDHDAAIELIVGGYQRLQRLDPQHELLRYITEVTSQGFRHVRERYDSFLERFETAEDRKYPHVKVAKVLTAYFVALRDAADLIEGKVKSPRVKESAPPQSIDEISDEDVPF